MNAPVGAADLISRIREVLGITLHPSTNPIANVRENGMLGTLSLLTEEQLSAVLAVSTKARQISTMEPTILHQLGHHVEANRTFTGNDCFHIRDLLFKGDVRNIYVLAPAVDDMPSGMEIRDALLVIRAVSDEMFDLKSAAIVRAHLHVSHSLHRQQRYSAHLMLLTQTHHDKTDAIIDLIRNGNLLPTHRGVVTHHGILSSTAPVNNIDFVQRD